MNRLIQTTDALGNLSTTVYDAAGNVAATIDARGNRTTLTYDALNRVIGRTDPLNHITTTVYDSAANVVQSIDPLSFTTTYAYDALNRKTSVQDPGGGIATTVYDAAGNAVNSIDQLNQKTTYVYDALNRRTQAIDPRGGVVTTVYDAVNNAVNVIDPVGNKTTMAYDALNRLVQQTDPLNHSATFAYDAASRLTSITDRNGRRRDFGYDSVNRRTSESWVASGSTVMTVTYTYDANGNQLTAANANGTYTYTYALGYDALNRVTTTQEPFGLTLTATYDAVGNRTLLQDSLSGVTTSVYDAANRLTSRQFGGSGQTPLRIDPTYTSRDQLASLTRYSDLAGTQKTGSSVYTYDSVGRVSNVQHKNATEALLANYTYTYDLASRLLTETLNSSTTTYSYDSTNQLTNDSTATYTYDLNGNRTMTGYQTGSANQLTNDGMWTYTYDNEGSLIKKSKGTNAETWTYGYDNLNNLTSTQQRQTDGGTLLMQATYTYDVFGNRLEKDVWISSSGTTTVTRFGYDRSNVWADLNGSSQLLTRRLYLDGMDQLFVRINSSGTAAWYLSDRLGSVRDITDASGMVQDHLNYDGFGNVLTESNSTFGDRYKWTERELDAETGLQYNRARYYGASIGRWMRQDPIGFDAGDVNLYRYVGNGPTNATDPSGLAVKGVDFSYSVDPDAIERYLLNKDGKVGYFFQMTITWPLAQAPGFRTYLLGANKTVTFGIKGDGTLSKAKTQWIVDKSGLLPVLTTQATDRLGYGKDKSDWILFFRTVDKKHGFSQVDYKPPYPSGHVSDDDKEYNEYLNHMVYKPKNPQLTYSYLYLNGKLAKKKGLNEMDIKKLIMNETGYDKLQEVLDAQDLKGITITLGQTCAEVYYSDKWMGGKRLTLEF